MPGTSIRLILPLEVQGVTTDGHRRMGQRGPSLTIVPGDSLMGRSGLSLRQSHSIWTVHCALVGSERVLNIGTCHDPPCVSGERRAEWEATQ